MAAKWWGWGDDTRTFALADPDRFWSFARRRLGDVRDNPRLQSLNEIDSLHLGLTRPSPRLFDASPAKLPSP